jgi:hypothetical protein
MRATGGLIGLGCRGDSASTTRRNGDEARCEQKVR